MRERDFYDEVCSKHHLDVVEPVAVPAFNLNTSYLGQTIVIKGEEYIITGVELLHGTWAYIAIDNNDERCHLHFDLLQYSQN